MIAFVVFSALSYQDVRPIFVEHCAKCHNESTKTTNWLNYEMAYAQRTVIRQSLKNYFMPPQGMPGQDRELIIKWIDDGAQP